MPRRKKPSTLMEIAVKNTDLLIYTACRNIERKCQGELSEELFGQIDIVRNFLWPKLPARIMDLLCETKATTPELNPFLQLSIFLHPGLKALRNCSLNTPEKFWFNQLPTLTKLVVLDLKLVCTDEILQVVGKSCPLIEELNIISKVTLVKSFINASVLQRYVSDVGLRYISELKLIKILTMDTPKHNARVGKFVSQNGVRKIVHDLPLLELLLIETCDIASTLLTEYDGVTTLNLKKVNCCSIKSGVFTKIASMCPSLVEMSIANIEECTAFDFSAAMKELANSHLKLKRLDIKGPSYAFRILDMLKVKGTYLTQLEIRLVGTTSMSYADVETIGKYCPNVHTLSLLMKSEHSNAPVPVSLGESKIFPALKNLTIGYRDYEVVCLLFSLFERLTLNKVDIIYEGTLVPGDMLLLYSLQQGYLNNLTSLHMSCKTLLSDVICRKVIERCKNLDTLIVNRDINPSSIRAYIKKNNFDCNFNNIY